MSHEPQAPSVVVLKASALAGDLISQEVKRIWRGVRLQVFQKGFDALDAIQCSVPDLFVTGVQVDDMDGLEHLEPFIESTLAILIVTRRRDDRTLSLLRDIRYTGLFDEKTEGWASLQLALKRVAAKELYISSTFVPHIKAPKRVTLDVLTEKEELVLSVIGDGCDDIAAAERLKLSPHTVNSHRKSIMAKLGLHHKGEIMSYALEKGYVCISAEGVTRPGFQRKIDRPPGSGRDDRREKLRTSSVA